MQENKPTRTGRDLPTLASEINAEHEAAERAINDSLQHARRCGELLLEAKGQCEHGEWLPWLEGNFRATPRTAQGYMRLAKADTQRVSHLPIREALAALAQPREADSKILENVPDGPPDDAEPVPWMPNTPDWESLVPATPAWLVPAPGAGLAGTFEGGRAWILPSSRSGFYYVTTMIDKDDGGATIRGSVKPVSPTAFAFCLDGDGCPWAETSWRVLPNPQPRDFNHLLFESREDYVDHWVLAKEPRYKSVFQERIEAADATVRTLEECEAVIEAGLAVEWETADHLREAWEGEFGRDVQAFNDFIRGTSMEPATAHRYVRASAALANLSKHGCRPLPRYVHLVEPLLDLDPAEQVDVWTEACRRAANG